MECQARKRGQLFLPSLLSHLLGMQTITDGSIKGLSPSESRPIKVIKGIMAPRTGVAQVPQEADSSVKLFAAGIANSLVHGHSKGLWWYVTMIPFPVFVPGFRSATSVPTVIAKETGLIW